MYKEDIMTTSYERVLIVIVNYKSARLTLDCLASLEPELRGVPDAHVVVVENASGDGPALEEGIRTRGFSEWVTLDLSDKNGGFAYGNNRAIAPALASAKPPAYVLLLNPDTRIYPGAVKELLAFMDRRPDVGIAGSSFEDDEGEDWPYAFRFPSVWSELDRGLQLGVVTRLLSEHVVAQRMGKTEAPIDWVPGASMMIRSQVFRDIGLMDDGYFLYYEETDFCLRAKRAGWPTWYVPQSHVVHIAGQSTGVTQRNRRPPRTPEYWFASRRRYFTKNHGLAYAISADLLFGTSFGLSRARHVLTRKQDGDPPKHLLDHWKNSVLFKRG